MAGGGLELGLLLGATGLEPGTHSGSSFGKRGVPAMKPVRDSLGGNFEGLCKISDPSSAGLAEDLELFDKNIGSGVFHKVFKYRVITGLSINNYR